MKLAALSIAILPFAATAAFQTSFDRDFTAETSAGPVQGGYSAEVLWENLATCLAEKHLAGERFRRFSCRRRMLLVAE